MASDLRRFKQFLPYVPTVIQEPVLVKVGANDGIGGDPCPELLAADTKWKGLLIEPVPYLFKRLHANIQFSPRFCLEQIAIGAKEGYAPFYYVDEKAKQAIPNLPPWFDNLGSFDQNHILKHLDGILAPFIIKAEVRVAPLSVVLARNKIQEVHLLHVDTEGHDYEVLKTLDFAQCTPIAIFIEHKHLSEVDKLGMLQLLGQRNYNVQDCGDDFFAIQDR